VPETFSEKSAIFAMLCTCVKEDQRLKNGRHRLTPARQRTIQFDQAGRAAADGPGA